MRLRLGAAEQPVDRDAVQPARDVPQGHVEAGDGVDQERPAADVAVGAVGAVQLLPEELNPRRVLAIEQLEQRVDQAVGPPWLQGADLPPAADLVAGLELDVDLGDHDVRLQGGDAELDHPVLGVGG
jgi:hypothetical protein